MDEVGTIRVSTKSLKPYVRTKKGWKKINLNIKNLLDVVKLFKAHNKFNFLIDTKNPKFLKGGLSFFGREIGTRINILPNGQKLEKAFSLFSPHLKIHDQTSHDHWDVLYQNKGGTWSYVYTLKKRNEHKTKKYKKVEKFEKYYPKLIRNLKKSFNKDIVSFAIYTLLKTNMRVGNEIYYKMHNHKGLTTLTKNDIKIKDNYVYFNYIGKGGVPIRIIKKFSKSYINELKIILNNRKRKEFVFSKEGHPIKEIEFKKCFKKHCGEEFYPHIIRSFYATTMVKKFLKSNKKITNKEKEKLFLSIAHDLGHKKFNKKKNLWEDHYTVTVNSYVQPKLIKTINKRLIK